MDKEKDLPRMKYEYKHYGMPVEAVLLGVKELLFDSIHESVAAWQSSISKRSENKLEEIREVLLKIVDEYVLEVSKHLDIAEPTIRTCFAIPEHVLLPGDEIQRQQFTKDEEMALDKKLENLQFRYKQAYCMEKILQEERKGSGQLDRIEFETSKLQKLQDDKLQTLDMANRLLQDMAALNLATLNET